MREALDSLQAQTYTNYELVFVCSIASTIRAVQDYCSDYGINLSLAFSNEPNNRKERFALGIWRCVGDWICNFDSDDILHPQALEIVSQSLDLFPNLDFFSGTHISFESGKQCGYTQPAEPGLQMINSLIAQFRQRHFWGFTADKNYWPKGWLENSYPCEDYWMFASIAMEGRPVLPIPHCIYGWRQWPGQFTARNRDELHAMCSDISSRLTKFAKRQGPLWHFGDLSLAARMSLAQERIGREISFR